LGREPPIGPTILFSPSHSPSYSLSGSGVYSSVCACKMGPCAPQPATTTKHLLAQNYTDRELKASLFATSNRTIRTASTRAQSRTSPTELFVFPRQNFRGTHGPTAPEALHIQYHVTCFRFIRGQTLSHYRQALQSHPYWTELRKRWQGPQHQRGLQHPNKKWDPPTQ
jgi:hypothetical protein